MSQPRTCRLVTLGCKVNQYETQYVKETLEPNGYREAAHGEPADLCVVNTCTVTAEGDAKGRQLVRRLAPRPTRSRGSSSWAVTPPAIRKTVARLPGVTHVITDKNRLLDGLRDFGVTGCRRGITRFDGHQRAFVKVQDGCLLNCTLSASSRTFGRCCEAGPSKRSPKRWLAWSPAVIRKSS